MLSSRTSPALVSAAAAKKIPRILFFLFLFIFIAPRLLSPDLWFGRSMTSYGVAWTMLTGNFGDWLFPNIDGDLIFNRGPMTAWVCAFFMTVFKGILPPVSSFHLTTGLWFIVLTGCTWYGTYYLARRDEAQPLALVFGGEAARKDYARLIADIATFLLIGTYGTVLPLHEVSPATTLLALSSVLFLGIVISLDNARKGSIISGVAIGLASMTASFGSGVWFLLTAICAIYFTKNYTSSTRRVLYTALIGVGIALIWPFVCFVYAPGPAIAWFAKYISNSFDDLSLLQFSDYVWIVKNFAWILLPSWPFALLCIYLWRSNIRSAHISIPLVFLVISVASILFTGIDARSMAFCALPPMAALGAFGIVAVKKSTENLLDGFSGIVFSLGLAVAWIYFIAWHYGYPEKMAHSIQRLAPHVAPTPGVFYIVLAALATFTWGLIILWRLRRHPRVLWRGALMGATGLCAFVVTVDCLFGGLIDGARTMDRPVTVMKAEIQKLGIGGKEFCRGNLSHPEVAAFFALGGIRFTEDPQKCSYEITTHKLNPKVHQLDSSYILAVVPGRPRSDYSYIISKMH